MQKEIVIITVIIIAIILTDVLTQKYTTNNFNNINNKLDNIMELGKEIKAKEKTTDKNLEEKKEELLNEIENMKNEWKEINKTVALYIEHNELEKVSASMIKFNSYFELEEYNEAISEVEDCKYILNHIKEKEAMQFINLF